MNLKPTQWKVIVSLLGIILNYYLRLWYAPGEDSNLVISLGPSIFVYLIWSVYEKKKDNNLTKVRNS